MSIVYYIFTIICSKKTSVRFFPLKLQINWEEITRTIRYFQFQASFRNLTIWKKKRERGKMLYPMSVLFYFSAYFMLYRALKDLLDYWFSLVAAYIRNLVKNNNSSKKNLVYFAISKAYLRNLKNRTLIMYKWLSSFEILNFRKNMIIF